MQYPHATTHHTTFFCSIHHSGSCQAAFAMVSYFHVSSDKHSDHPATLADLADVIFPYEDPMI
jgi:hypothetical protein